MKAEHTVKSRRNKERPPYVDENHQYKPSALESQWWQVYNVANSMVSYYQAENISDGGGRSPKIKRPYSDKGAFQEIAKILGETTTNPTPQPQNEHPGSARDADFFDIYNRLAGLERREILLGNMHSTHKDWLADDRQKEYYRIQERLDRLEESIQNQQMDMRILTENVMNAWEQIQKHGEVLKKLCKLSWIERALMWLNLKK